MAMFRNITIGQYIPGDSPIHRLDPRTKIIITILLILVLFFVTSFVGYALAALFIAASVKISGVSPRLILRGLRPLLIIIVLTLSLHFFLTDGTVVFRLGPLKVTQEGLIKGGLMGSRLILLVLGTSLLTLTTSPISLTDGLEYLLSPGKRIGVPAHELAMMMTIALRFIPTLMEEMEKIMKAQMARGADFDTGGFLSRAKSLIPLLVPLFVSAFRRADELAIAMESRCYRGGEGRTKFRELVMTRLDVLSLALTLVYFFVLAWRF